MLKRLWVTNDFLENYSSVYLDDLYINVFLERKKKSIFLFHALPTSSALYLLVFKKFGKGISAFKKSKT